jgi:hypothetical protein
MDRDLSRSRAILISNAAFRDPKLPDLPAAAGSTFAMKTLLTGELCGWPADRVESLREVGAPSELATRLVDLVEGIDDVLLLYYVGHGMRTSKGQLALALAGSNAKPDLVSHTAILYESIAEILRGCPAATKLVILDCCFAELGTKANYQTQSIDMDDAESVEGLYFIGASKKHQKARSPLGDGLPYFTQAFIDVVTAGIPGRPALLTIDQIFVHVRARLQRANLPEPVQSGIRDAHQWPFSRNAARQETQVDPEQVIAALNRRLAESEELRAARDAEILALQAQAKDYATELRRLRLQAAGAPAMTSDEQRELRSAIDTTERLLDGSVAAEAAVRAEYGAHPFSAVPRPVPHRLGGRYELRRIVGRGSRTEVREARDLRLGRVVAVKILAAAYGRDQTLQAGLRAEGALLGALRHPSVVTVYATGDDASTGGHIPYLVMEYVDGRTVGELLQAGRLVPERTLEITAGLLHALEYLHGQGIVHRNINPESVMVNREGRVKVIAFGHARTMRDSAAGLDKVSSGIWYYVSPEQVPGKRIDGRSDLYSVGCLMYELLTGQTPFAGKRRMADGYSYNRGQPAPPSSRLDPGLPPWADPIVLRALANSPDDRYPSAAAMLADIQRAVDGWRAAGSGRETPPRSTAGGRGLLLFGRDKVTPEPEVPAAPETKLVRQQPVRQARSKRSGTSGKR